ncbi:transposable element Tc1 transposase [Elysia marginata]|uniref:Transposable element Tc1 transposase n=1 Tax=Elysia marginata TaxID=1093978 RepID=A0AAV4GPM2_9GAST|nr:transposable element Tc1 transposase [Elysia marginata]
MDSQGAKKNRTAKGDLEEVGEDEHERKRFSLEMASRTAAHRPTWRAQGGLSLSEADGHRALGLLQAGLPISEVSLRMNANRTTIFKLRQRLHETNTVSDRPRSGRPRCTTQRQDRNLVRNHMNNRFLSASASSRQTRGRNKQRISANTVRRRLSTSGIRARRPYIGLILTQRHRHQRTLWAQEHAA